MKKHNKLIKVLAILLALMLSLGMLSGCKKKVEDSSSQGTQVEDTQEAQEEATADDDNSQVDEEDLSDADSDEKEEDNASDYDSEDSDEYLPEDGTYYSKDEVALYLHLYGHLPDNFITKKDAKKLGWSGGSLEKFAPGMVIGGDNFGNYEGNLPDGKKYYECDIDTYKKKKRGAKRIVWSEDGDIYYTDDHYETFELLYEGDS